MEITQDKIDLINKIIKNNRKYIGNEDLQDDFFNETYKRSMAIINVIDNKATLESYLKKVASTSIITVLKNSGRLRRSKAGYLASQELPLSAVSSHGSAAIDSVMMSESEALENYVGTYNDISYASANIAISPEDNVLHNEVVDFIADTLENINEQEPEARYLDIFIMRYDKCLTQKQMAQELGISQSEVSKRIYGLLERVKSVLDEQ